ncbi:MAG TPA: PqqD family protein [Pyrinomonadaceae bacterium]|nr:PqqD family protein [Pyrinomonadaceae bacterium]
MSERKIRPLARAEGLVVRELPEEVLVYDLDTHRAMCLNRTAALVWKSCDGRNDVAAIARALRAEFGAHVPEEVVWLALERLSRDRLIAERVRRPASLAGLSRRDVIKKVGLAAAVALPVVSAIVAPTTAEAASCLPTGSACTAPAQCCSGACPGAPNGTCL